MFYTFNVIRHLRAQYVYAPATPDPILNFDWKCDNPRSDHCVDFERASAMNSDW